MSESDPPDPIHIAGLLISNLCDECITPEETEQLDFLVRTNPEVRQLYVRMMHLQCGLHEYASVLGIGSDDAPDNSASTDPSSNMNETMVVPALLDPIEVDDSNLQPRVSELPRRRKPSAAKYIAWSSIAAAVLAAFAVLLHYSGSNVKPDAINTARQLATSQEIRPPDVVPEVPAIASIAQLAGPVWGDAHTSLVGQKLAAGDEIWLKSGCVEIALATGGRAIVEGPARLTLTSGSEVFLAYGQIAATIPGGGFAVKTPSGVLRDLGTQFGVAVKPNGTTRVEVFEGRVTAELASATTQPLTISAGQAATVSHAAVGMDPGGAVPQRFVTRLSSDINSLDLVDLVSGGDGSTHRRAGAINAVTGEFRTVAAVGMRDGDRAIHPVPALPVIDCAFVPDGSNGPMAIDSALHKFEFPATSNSSVNCILAGGAIPWYRAQGISTVLDGVDYSAAEHGLLCIHSNNGMTLDLQALRRLYPDRLVSGFHCTIGNSYENGTRSETGVDPRADVFVIIDGKSRFEKRQFTHRDGTFNVNVPIDATDHFLTLATTDGGDGINDDWVLWVDPVLKLSPRPDQR